MAIFCYSKLYYDYWWLLMAIFCYSKLYYDYWWLLMAIFGYSKLYYDYWWLFYYKLLLNILDYIIIGYY